MKTKPKVAQKTRGEFVDANPRKLSSNLNMTGKKSSIYLIF